MSFPGSKPRAVLLVGLGLRRRFEPGAAFSAGFALAKRLAGKRRDGVAVVLPPADHPPVIASALIEGAIAGTRGPGVRKTEAVRHAFETLSLVVGDRPDRGTISQTREELAPRRDRRPCREPGPRPGEYSARGKVAEASRGPSRPGRCRRRAFGRHLGRGADPPRAIRRPAGRRRGLGRASTIRRPRLPARGRLAHVLAWSARG